MDQENADKVRKIIEHVSIFRRMTMAEADAVLKICVVKTFAKGELTYREGTPSDEMLILLQGKLTATAESGTALGRIAPGTTTGEMGLLTNSPRSANVVATDGGTGFVIKKAAFNRLLDANDRLKIKVYENLVDVLCHRLQDANIKIDTQTASAF